MCIRRGHDERRKTQLERKKTHSHNKNVITWVEFCPVTLSEKLSFFECKNYHLFDFACLFTVDDCYRPKFNLSHMNDNLINTRLCMIIDVSFVSTHVILRNGHVSKKRA
jgi:hypothetical protein